MTNIDIGVILVFTILVFICGMSFSRSGKNMKSYFAAGGALPWWMSGLSLFMSFFSAGTFVVWGSIAYSNGWLAITIQWTMSIAGLIIGFYIAPKWQKTKSLTAAEFITNRLGYKTQRIYTYIFLLITSFSTGAFLYPVGKIVEVSTGISISLCVIFLGVIILIYTAVGGLWAVIVTDILQFVVLTAVVLIVFPLSFEKIGGVENFISQAPEGFFSWFNSEYTWEFVVAFGLYNLFFIGGNWAYIQRYTSVSTPKDAKKAGWLFGILYFISPVLWMLPPMIYKVLNPDLAGLADEGAYLLICKEILPLGMLGLMLGGMIFATSSSVNTALNITAGVLANDVYKHFYPKSSDHQLVKVGKTATILLGVITIIVALLIPFMGGIVEVVMSLAAITGGALFLPPVWSLFSRHHTGNSILFVTISTLTINIFFKFFSPLLLDIKLNRAEEMGVGIGIPIILLTIYEVYAIINSKVPEQYKKYLEIVAKKNSSSNEESREANMKGTKVIGIGIASTGILMTVLALIAEHSQYYVGSTGIIICLVGALIYKKNQYAE